MKQPRKIPGILIYLLILFFSVIGFVYALHSNVKEGYKQVVNLGGSEKTSDGVEVSKIIEETKLENYFDITLTVKTSSKIEEITKAQDIAVVIVMDISRTMATNDMEGSETSRLDEAKNAAMKFVTTFQKEAATEGASSAKRQIGFVTFATDSYQVFGLSDCKTEVQRDEMISQIDEIETKTEEKRFTNMEAGLGRARNMLANSEIKNQYIIFLTDGLPTTYSTTIGGNTGYNPQATSTVTNPTSATPGLFYNFNTKQFMESWAGTNYSDYGARRAEEQTKEILKDNIKMYTIGVGIKHQHTLYHLRHNGYAYTFDTDTEANNLKYYGNRYYAVMPGVTVPLEDADTDSSIAAIYDDQTRQYYKKWLKEYMSSGEGFYFDSEQSGDILNSYSKIFEGIKEMTEESAQATWVAEDPMGVDGAVENIEFVGFLDDASSLQKSLKNGETNQSDTATITNNKINWDLKDSTYTTTTEENITYYYYSVKYRVRIENELDSFSTDKIYDTNGVTKLTYVTRNNGVLSENKEVEFPIPSVVAYLGEFSFTKKNASFDDIASGVLEGAEFTLTHDPNCPCTVVKDTNHIHMSENQKYVETSDADGIVKFTKIPSGHKYILSETKAPDNYNGTTETYNINVAYGETTGGPADGIVENTIQKGKLKITKTVEGNKDYSGDFEFEVTLTYKTTTLTGKYDYKIFNDSNEEISSGEIDLTKGKFKLKDGEYIIIYGLPIGSKYTVKELTTNGYTVKHGINTEERTTGATATCSSTDCDINNGGTQTVNFYNIAGYILPATGDSGMLILIIIASLLIIGPIIDIGYMFYKYRKEDKLTS